MKKKNNIDLSAYDGEIIDLNNYLDKRRASAIEKSRTRKRGMDKPENWDKEYPGHNWLNCIATGTDNYSGDSYEKHNPAFHDNPDKYGFRQLNDDEPSIPGDIVQHYYIDSKTGKAQDPFHAVFVDEVDDKGNITKINYSNGDIGEQNYYVGAKNYWHPSDKEEVYGSEWYNGVSVDKIGKPAQYRYRYIGTPAERQAIDSHNASIREQRLKQNPEVKPLQVPVQPSEPAKASEAKKKWSIFDLADMAK